MTLERKESRSWLRRFGDRWGARDLVVIGVFAATAKLSTVLIAMVGGGMNPVSLLLKNVVFTDRKSTRLNSSHSRKSRMPSSA